MTTALIPINYDGEQPTVSARALHTGLGIRSNFTICQNRDNDALLYRGSGVGQVSSQEISKCIDTSKQNALFTLGIRSGVFAMHFYM